MLDIKEWLGRFKVSAESDDLLLEYFYKTDIVEDLLETNKWLVLGRKGTGKSAIYNYLLNSNKNNIGLSFKDYPWKYHQLYKDEMENEFSSYNKAWEYLFLVQIIIKLYNIGNKNSHSKEMNEAYKLILNLYGNPNPTVIDVIKTKLGSLTSASVLGLFSIEFADSTNNPKYKHALRYNSENLCQYLNKIIENEIENKKIFILVDQLDEQWLKDEVEEYKKILVSLLNTTSKMNCSKFKNNIKIIVFLRNDIYNSLVFNDKNKMLNDSSVTIKWDEASLNKMFMQRIES